MRLGAGTDTSRHMTPQRVSQVFTDRAGDATPGRCGHGRTRVLLPIFPVRITYTAAEPVAAVGLIFTTPSRLASETDGSAIGVICGRYPVATTPTAASAPYLTMCQRDVGTAAAGTHAAASRSDHVHGGSVTTTDATLSDADPEDTGTTAPGTSDDVSRSDHVHESSWWRWRWCWPI